MFWLTCTRACSCARPRYGRRCERSAPYWVDSAQGIWVDTTVDRVSGEESGSPHHSVVRFSAQILPGQSLLISVPGLEGAQTPALQIRRLANQDGHYRIQVQRIAAASHSS